jgi:hypothetical protein
MAHPEHLKIIKRGVKAWNIWRGKVGISELPDLRGADLKEAVLDDADL